MNIRSAFVNDLVRILVEARERRHQQSAKRTAERACAQAAERAAIQKRQVAMLHQARLALIREGLSREAATTALIAIDHKRVPHVHIDFAPSESHDA